MRILVANWSSRRVGGVESYLHALLPALVARGEEVALFAGTDEPTERAPIAPPGVRCWSTTALGRAPALAAARAWAPDVVFVHNVDDLALAESLREVAPAAWFAHAYYGTCVSGEKQHKFPRPVPCGRELGPACLALYLPRRCGGLSPVTMLRRYAHERARRADFDRWRAIVVASEHMRVEYRRHAPAGTPVHRVPMPRGGELPPPPSATERAASLAGRRERRLLMVGRLDRAKGGALLLDALPEAARLLGRPLDLLVAGDGPDREALAAHAARVEAAHPDVRARLGGWLDGAALDAAYRERDLLVVPSTWPEPFGLVGAEAGVRGMPAVAFAVGGIPDWLRDGENGCLAAGRRPDARALAAAIARALDDDAGLARLGDGARRAAEALTMDAHLDALLPLLEAVAASRAAPQAAPA